MRYHFGSCIRALPILEELEADNLLLSFALDAKQSHKVQRDQNVIIDSGAFSVWSSGAKIDIDEYLAFCLEQPKHWTFVNLDVIPSKGSSKAEIEKCCEEGFENYMYLKDKLPSVMPVYHSGEKMKWLKKFMAETDYIGVGFGNDRGELARIQFLKEVFDKTGTDFKIHGLGYSAYEGLTMFPFFSVDSVSFKTYHNLYNSGINFWTESKHLTYYMRYNIKKFLKMEKQITQLWEHRGIKW